MSSVSFKSAIDAAGGEGHDSSLRVTLVDATGDQIQAVTTLTGEPVTTTHAYRLETVTWSLL